MKPNFYNSEDTREITIFILRSNIILIPLFVISTLTSYGIHENKPTENKFPQNTIMSSASREDFDLMPDGKSFSFWEDQTKYNKILHVAQKNAKASDNNPGTLERPFKTINAAAKLLQPGEKVIVHEGIYRECIQPARGGTSAEKMICYEAAKGEKVIVKGSEIWKPILQPSTGWNMRGNQNGQIMMADIPEDLFKAYNPFSIRNVYHYLTVYGQPNDPEWMTRAMMFRGMVFLNGTPLKQVYKINELTRSDSAFWVEDPGLKTPPPVAKGV